MRILITLAAIILIVAGCAPETEDDPAGMDANNSPSTQGPDNEAETGTRHIELAGTSWQLLKIAGMDDSLDVPGDSSMYTMVFGIDGSATMQADCNRGASTWTSESPGQLVFGPVVSTRAMCPEGSLSEKYLAQFEWVRSYVYKDGHLFLATMADGAIIEFEPADSGDSQDN